MFIKLINSILKGLFLVLAINYFISNINALSMINDLNKSKCQSVLKYSIEYIHKKVPDGLVSVNLDSNCQKLLSGLELTPQFDLFDIKFRSKNDMLFFRKPNLRYLHLSNAIAQDSYIEDAILLHTKIRNTNYKGSFFHRVYWGLSYLENIKLNYSYISKVNFNNSEIIDTDFSYSNLLDSTFQRAKLINVNFEGANLENVDFEGSVIDNVNFYKAINLSCSQIRKAKKIINISGIDCN